MKPNIPLITLLMLSSWLPLWGQIDTCELQNRAPIKIELLRGNTSCINGQIETHIVTPSSSTNRYEWSVDGAVVDTTSDTYYLHRTLEAGEFSLSAKALLEGGCSGPKSNALSFTVKPEESPIALDSYFSGEKGVSLLIAQDYLICHQWARKDKITQEEEIITGQTNQHYGISDLKDTMDYDYYVYTFHFLEIAKVLNVTTGVCPTFNDAVCTTKSSHIKPLPDIFILLDWPEEEAEEEPLPIELSMQIQPNPNNGHFFLLIEGIAGSYQVQITDYLGRLIYEDEIEKGQEIYEQSLSLPFPIGGRYILSVMNKEEEYITKQFIIQH